MTPYYELSHDYFIVRNGSLLRAVTWLFYCLRWLRITSCHMTILLSEMAPYYELSYGYFIVRDDSVLRAVTWLFYCPRWLRITSCHMTIFLSEMAPYYELSHDYFIVRHDSVLRDVTWLYLPEMTPYYDLWRVSCGGPDSNPDRFMWHRCWANKQWELLIFPPLLLPRN